VPWARAGGDEVARAYCERLGLFLDPDRLEALVFAYSLDRVASQLRSNAHRSAHRLWLDRNISFVLSATTQLIRSPVGG
jgi:hypothetical protein